MSYTTTQLINGAYYAAGIVSRDFETVSGGQLSDGLGWLNDILGDKTVENGMVPYETEYAFDMNIGQEVYYIPNLIMIDTLTFTLNTVRYSMQYQGRNAYFGSNRVNNINSLPFQWFFERKFGGGNLHMYFAPDRAYPVVVHGAFRLPEVNAAQDLTTSIARVDLGTVSVSGAGTLNAGEFVVNGIDLAGTYATATALTNYINTGVIPNTTALLYNNVLTLTNTAEGGTITLVTDGTASTSNSVSFYNFKTTAQQKSETFYPIRLDRFYITYLRYALAMRICTEFNRPVPQAVAQEYNKYCSWIDKQSNILDLTTEKISTLQDGGGLNYAMINLGRGFVAPY